MSGFAALANGIPMRAGAGGNQGRVTLSAARCGAVHMPRRPNNRRGGTASSRISIDQLN
jgi:hypothetical protein